MTTTCCRTNLVNVTTMLAEFMKTVSRRRLATIARKIKKKKKRKISIVEEPASARLL